MKDKLYIPKKINVGFQEREGTYTGLLAYVIYWDDKGVLRKEKSWESWRHKQSYTRGWGANATTETRETDVTPKAFDNVPTEGFVLNKRAGGYSTGWNHRQTYCRVYDPRGFEFEISVENLLFILQECTSTKGKGLEGEFVYSWQGTELVLLPVSSQDYQESIKYTGLQAKKVTKKDMVPGCSYTTKQGDELIYLGRFDYYEMGYVYLETKEEAIKREGYRWASPKYYYGLTCEKRHVFLKEDGTWEDNYKPCPYHTEKGFTKLATRNTEEPVDNYSDLLEEFHNSMWGSPVKEFAYEDTSVDLNDLDDNSWRKRVRGNFAQIGGDSVTTVNILENRDYRDDKFLGWDVNRNYTYKLKNGVLIRDYTDGNTREKVSADKVLEIEFKQVFAVLEGGNKIEIEKYN